MKRLELISLLLAGTSVLSAQPYTISAFAGGHLPPTPAVPTAVSIGGQFSSAATGPSGTVYIADALADVVYKLQSGILTIVAGNGSAGFAGDGGSALGAELSSPNGVAVDATGALYIADGGNYRVRKIVNGVITTVAGNGSEVFTTDGVPATQTGVNPFSIAVDTGGNLYINEFNRIRKVPSSGIINTIAGGPNSGDTGDGGPASLASIACYSIATDASGNIYLADRTDNVIREINAAGVIKTIAGNRTRGFSGDGGPAKRAQLNGPAGVAVDGAGNVYIADSSNNRVRKINPSGTISTLAGDGYGAFSGDGGPATSASLYLPTKVAADSAGDVFISDSLNARLREVATTGIITTVAGNGFPNEAGDGGLAIQAQFLTPYGLSITSSGNLYVADEGNVTVRVVSPSGVVNRVAGSGIYGYAGDGGPALQAEFSPMEAAVSDGNGNLYIADTENCVIRKVAPDGTISTFAGNGVGGYSGDGQVATDATLNYPKGLAVDSSGNLYIADSFNNVVRKVDATLTITTVAGQASSQNLGDGGPATQASLEEPTGLAFDTAGNLYITDTYHHRIREVFAATGIITTIAGTGNQGYSGDGGPGTSADLNTPVGVAVDAAGNVYFTEYGNNVVRKLSTNSIIATIAGTGAYGYSGDDGPALDAEFNMLQGIAVGSNGTVYVSDSGNNAIRQLTICPVQVGGVNADASAQTVGIPLTAASSCQWAATGLPAWITSASSGTGPGTLALALQANNTGADRTATISVNGVSVTVTQDFTTATFTDVLPGTYYFDAVNLLKIKNITAGCGSTEYCPTSVVTRDQMAIFIVRTVLGGDTFTYSPTPYFEDVPTTYFAFKWIQKLYELGVTAGCSVAPLNYCPGNVVTRDQMAIFIIRARYGSTTPFTWNQTPYFADVPSTYFAFQWIQRLYGDGITAGCALNPLQYCPTNPVIRGDVAIFLMRGGFNQLLPSTQPIIVSIVPETLSPGTTGSFTITGVNTAFQQGVTQLVFPVSSGVTVNSITVTSDTVMQASLSASPSAPLQPVSIYEQTEPQEAVLPNGLLIQ